MFGTNGSRTARLSALILGGVLTLGAAGAAVAQDETPPADAIVTHPAHIHVGSCAELDPNPLVPLNDVGPRLNDDDELPSGDDIKGSLDASPVEYSESEDLDVKFDDLFATAHAINVHESAANPQNYIACGDIGGTVLDDKVYVALHPQNDSGYFGIAIVEQDGDDNSKVTIYLANGGDASVPEVEGTPTT